MTVDSLAGRQSILSREALLKEHWKPVWISNAKYSHTVLYLIIKECRPRANRDLSLNIKKFVFPFKSKNIENPSRAKILKRFFLSTHVLQMLEEERKQAHRAAFARDLGQHCRAYIYARWVCRKLIEGDWLESKTWLESVMTRKCFCFVCSEQKPWRGRQREGERLSGAGGQQSHPITPFTSVQWNVCATRVTSEPRVLRVSPFKKVLLSSLDFKTSSFDTGKWIGGSIGPRTLEVLIPALI